MELKWLDDYIALIETGSFSAAAKRRHVSQPAFSRRIQLLEEWLGVTLIDRARKPLRFTPVAGENHAAFRGLVARIYEFRSTIKSESLDIADLTIVAQHTLTTSYVPAFLKRLRQMEPEQNFRIRSENRSDAVTMLMRGQAEILITYETAQTPCGIPPPIAQRQVLGVDRLVLVASPALHASLGAPRGDGAPVPMLCFPPESFFGQVVRLEALPELMRGHQVVVRCVSEFAIGLRELALVGQGVAWLPGSLIADDLRRGRLRPLETLGRSVDMDLVAYFAVGSGDKAALLDRQFQAFRGGADLVPGVAAKRSRAASPDSPRRKKSPVR
ncbi:MAG: LysR family transcriptional regulator [Burkholderiales bacterium]|nr:MAG: LysR family transcriptional regulator [Burkholderiales bacterium]